MSGFSDAALGPLAAMLPALNTGAAATTPPAGAATALSLAGWLGARGLPAAPWQPDPAWLAATPPSLPLDANAMATVGALAQLRAQALSQFGIDLLDPAQAGALAPAVASMSSQLTSIAPPGFDPSGWVQLGALNSAVDQAQSALASGVLTPSPPLAQAMNAPAGVPMASWFPLLRSVLAMAPLIASANQLGLNLADNFAPPLANALRTLRGVDVPPVPPDNLALMSNVSSALQATSQLQSSLGVDPLAIGLPATQALVAAKLGTTMQGLGSAMGVDPQAPGALAAALPALPYCPTTLAPPAVVQAALAVNPAAAGALAWQVPPLTSLPVLTTGLPATGLAAQLAQSLGITQSLGIAAVPV